ncbi:MAG: HD domain-containing protein [Muribaculaceae bacterium]|nr:HD domain-containing protein [Muribaculaceae bacterium]
MNNQDKINLLIEQFYPSDPALRSLLLTHSRCVADEALSIARALMAANPDLNLDLQFIEEATMLHDIGIANCDAPSIHCHGSLPYICHGTEGARILAEAGLLRHARVCERHTGSGLTAEEILDEALPIPARDMIPITSEEKIICYADKFYSKNPDSLTRRKSLEEVRKSIAKFGEEPLRRFDSLHQFCKGESFNTF